MANPILPEHLRQFEIPGRVRIAGGNGGLTKVDITTACSTAEVYLHGAHITGFQKKGDPPLLFMSHRSQFAAGKPIRGGVPICFPWFGPHEEGVHGFARVVEWELAATNAAPDGTVTIRLRLPPVAAGADWPSLATEFVVTVADRLTMELITTNRAPDRLLEFENCLHTYFAVGNIAQVSLAGLQDMPFDDFAFGAGGVRKNGDPLPLRITQETNRVYFDHAGAVEIRDDTLRRTIRVEKFSSRSTVVWNPWTTQKMPDDFEPGEHQRMVCVESGNVKRNAVSLSPGQSANLKVVLSSRAL